MSARGTADEQRAQKGRPAQEWRMRERRWRTLRGLPEVAALEDSAYRKGSDDRERELLRDLDLAVAGHEPDHPALAEIVAKLRPREAVEWGPVRRRESPCVVWLREYLADGPRKGSEVYAAAAAAGFSRRTVERARRPARIHASRGPGSRWERVR